MKLKIIFTVALLLFSFPAALIAENISSKFDDLVKYHPMKKGDVWIYAMFKDTPDEIITITECTNKQDEGCLYEHSIIGVKLHDAYQYIGNTVSRTITSNFMTGEISTLSPAEILLKSPIKVGTTWQNKSDDSVDKLKIIKILPKLKVIAGDFENVIVIESKQYENGKEMLRQLIYYAPNVGMIKTEGMSLRYSKGKGKDKMKKTRELIEYKPSDV